VDDLDGHANELDCIVDIPAATFAGRQFEDAHVCHDFAAAGAFERDVDEFEVCDKGMLRSMGLCPL